MRLRQRKQRGKNDHKKDIQRDVKQLKGDNHKETHTAKKMPTDHKNIQNDHNKLQNIYERTQNNDKELQNVHKKMLRSPTVCVQGPVVS